MSLRYILLALPFASLSLFGAPNDGNPKSEAKSAVLTPSKADVAGAVAAAPSAHGHWSVSAGYIYRNLGELQVGTTGGGHALVRDVVEVAQAAQLARFNDLTISLEQLLSLPISEFNYIDTASGWTDRPAASGGQIAVSWEESLNAHVSTGVEFGVSLLRTQSTASINTFDLVEDHFIPSWTTTWYSGNTLIGTETSPTVWLGSDHYFDIVNDKLQTTLTTLSLGPTISYQSGALRSSLKLGVALNIADWQATQTSTIYHASNGGPASPIFDVYARNSGTQLCTGFFLQSGVGVKLAQKWMLNGFGRYDWAPTVTGSVGYSTFTQKLSGWTVGASFSYLF